MDFIFIKDKKLLSEEILLKIENQSKIAWCEIESIEKNNSIMFFPKIAKKKCFVNDENMIGFISGFVRNYTLSNSPKLSDHNNFFLKTLLNDSWPFDDNWTGSFSAFVYDFVKNKSVVCNDPIGFYPLYYTFEGNNVVISTNLILLSKSINPVIDVAGVLQCITPQKYSNFGRRTMIKNVFRLLPGEFISFEDNAFDSMNRKFDNTLFGKNFDGDIDKVAKDMWKIIKEDMALILKYDTDVKIAQSGGMDSRLIIGAIPDNKNIECLTLGSYDFYETKIAEKCAKAKNAKFHYYPSEDFLFPELNILKEYVQSTEGTGDNEWIAMLEAREKPTDDYLLLGDMCEAIRSITNNTFVISKNSRIKNYIKNIFLNKDFEFTEANEETIKRWKEKKINESLPLLHLLNYINLPYDKEEIILDYKNDLTIMCELIDKFKLKYIEQYEMLFHWFTNSRQPSSRQTILNKKKFFPLTPTSSLRILRNSSYIKTEYLLYDRLVNKIFLQKELKKLADIPTNTIPFVKHSSSGPLKYLIWFYRATMDKYYINRIMKTKNPNLRYRVCKATNYPMIYQHKNAEKNIKSWFSNKILKGDKYIKIFMQRKNLERKTTFNQDLTIPASISITLDLIQNNNS